MTLKNSEYKVVDEKDETEAGHESADENVPIKGIIIEEFLRLIDFFKFHLGFDFAKLTAQWPSEKASLLSFKANLRKNEFDISKIKVWELKGMKIYIYINP